MDFRPLTPLIGEVREIYVYGYTHLYETMPFFGHAVAGCRTMLDRGPGLVTAGQTDEQLIITAGVAICAIGLMTLPSGDKSGNMTRGRSMLLLTSTKDEIPYI